MTEKERFETTENVLCHCGHYKDEHHAPESEDGCSCCLALTGPTAEDPDYDPTSDRPYCGCVIFSPATEPDRETARTKECPQ